MIAIEGDNRFKPILWKLDRAQILLEEILARAKQLQSRPEYAGLVMKPPSSTPTRSWLLGHRLPAPFRFYGLVADFVHNLRAPLDYLAWQLCGCPGGRSPAMPVRVAKPSKPICLPGSTTKAQHLVDEIQPYNRLGPDDPLNLLQTLWNQDKHRMTPLVAVDVWTHFAEPISHAHAERLPLPGSLAATAQASPALNKDFTLVAARPVPMTLSFAVDPTGKGRDLIGAAGELLAYVRDDIVPRFAYEDCFN